LSWNDGDTTAKHVFVEILDDELREGPEEFAIQLSDPTGGATLTPLKAAKVVVIADDDAPSGGGGTLGLVATAATVSEDRSLVLDVTRTGGSSGAVSVNYTTSPGTATAGADFTSKSGTLNWTDGDPTSKRIEVNVTNDTADESDETFTVTISNPSAGATLGVNFSAIITIADDDTPSDAQLELASAAETVSESGSIILSVLRTGSSSGAVSVSYATASDTASERSDFTGQSGTLTWVDGDSTSKTISIDVTSDTADESDETFTVTLSNPSPGATLGSIITAIVTISDDDSPGDDSPGGASAGGGRSDLLSLLALLLIGIARKRRGPAASHERRWADDLNEVKAYGVLNGSSRRTRRLKSASSMRSIPAPSSCATSGTSLLPSP